MLRGIARIFTHRWAGIGWCLVAMAFAATFAVSTVHSRHKEDFLRGRIAALATHDASQLQAELVSCRATVRTYSAAAYAAGAPRGGARPGETTQIKAVRGDPNSVAAQLVGTPPAGFDVCARMESADRAVLSALDHR
ncbi:hypothetical protein [Phenylobacterium sp.]|uniref:hypothetical protein n=1 Tax=Phenylobacterium sp. TaxID=1871053 RepID=UPI002DF5BB76|nr:hypothetical protein [Phenylobacterium sp.]